MQFKYTSLVLGTLFLAQIVSCDLDSQGNNTQSWMEKTISGLREGAEQLLKETVLASKSSCTQQIKDASNIAAREKALAGEVNTTLEDAKDKWAACKSAANVTSCRGEMLKNTGFQEAYYGKKEAVLLNQAATVIKALKSC